MLCGKYLLNPGLSALSQQHRNMADRVDLSSMRMPYKSEKDKLDIGDLVSKEPYKNFRNWLNLAIEAKDQIQEPNAMVLATATKDGIPSVRMVLLKEFDKKSGFVFYTNYRSRKAQELDANPNASLMFYWEVLNRQVRIEGDVRKIPEQESTEYFRSRPRSSQIGACVSENQSAVISGREVLEERQKTLEEQYGDNKEIAKPEYWGGYRLTPRRFEFWQGQSNRVHDRIVFRRPGQGERLDDRVSREGEEGWVIERLSP